MNECKSGSIWGLIFAEPDIWLLATQLILLLLQLQVVADHDTLLYTTQTIINWPVSPSRIER